MCHGFGHYKNACPNKRVVVGIFNEEHESEEEEEKYEASVYGTNLVLRTL